MTHCPLCLFPLARDRDGTHLVRCIYETLVEERPRQNRGKPRIATRWVEVERDPRRLVFSSSVAARTWAELDG